MEGLDNRENPVNIQGIMHEVKPCRISVMQLKRCGRKGCEIFSIKIEALREPLETTYQDDYIFEDGEIRKRMKKYFEDNYPHLRDFQDVFLEELLGLHPSRGFDSTIDLVFRLAIPFY